MSTQSLVGLRTTSTITAIALIGIGIVTVWLLASYRKSKDDSVFEGKPITYWLQKPVLDGKPVVYWLHRMEMDANDDRDRIRDQLVAVGDSITTPLLAALEAHLSSFGRKLQTSAFVVNNMRDVTRWLQSQPYGASWMAAYTLKSMPPNPRIREALIRELHHAQDKLEDSNIGFHAVQALATHYTNDWAAVIPELRDAMRSPHGNVRAEAARSIPSFGTNGLIALPELIRLLNDNDSDVIAHSARALGKFGSDAVSALPTLTPLKTNSTALVRRSAAVAIWRIAPETEFPLEIFLGCMESDRTQERVFAAAELVKLNPSQTEAAIRTYVKTISAPPDFTFGQTNHAYRIISARNLGELGPVAEAALPILTTTAESDTHPEVRQAAKTAVQKIAQANRNLTP